MQNHTHCVVSLKIIMWIQFLQVHLTNIYGVSSVRHSARCWVYSDLKKQKKKKTKNRVLPTWNLEPVCLSVYELDKKNKGSHQIKSEETLTQVSFYFMHILNVWFFFQQAFTLLQRNLKSLLLPPPHFNINTRMGGSFKVFLLKLHLALIKEIRFDYGVRSSASCTEHILFSPRLNSGLIIPLDRVLKSLLTGVSASCFMSSNRFLSCRQCVF